MTAASCHLLHGRAVADEILEQVRKEAVAMAAASTPLRLLSITFGEPARPTYTFGINAALPPVTGSSFSKSSCRRRWMRRTRWPRSSVSFPAICRSSGCRRRFNRARTWRACIPNRGVIGHSEIVGKPIAFLLMTEGATVTVCHHMTRSVVMHARRADAVFVAVGKPNLVTADDQAGRRRHRYRHQPCP